MENEITLSIFSSLSFSSHGDFKMWSSYFKAWTIFLLFVIFCSAGEICKTDKNVELVLTHLKN